MSQQDLPSILPHLIFVAYVSCANKIFPQRKSRFYRRFSHWKAQKRGFMSKPLKPNFNKVDIIC